MRYVLHRLTSCLFGQPSTSLELRGKLPAFVLDLFCTRAHPYGSRNRSEPSLVLRYPRVPGHNIWLSASQLHGFASFFVRTHSNPTLYHLIQHLLLVVNHPTFSPTWSLVHQIHPDPSWPYNPPFSLDAQVEHLYAHLCSSQARVRSASAPTTAPPQIFEMVQVTGSAKAATLQGLATKHMLGVIVDLQNSDASAAHWILIHKGGPGYIRDESQCASLIASYLAAVAIQLARLVRQIALEIGWTPASAPLTMHQWRTRLVPLVTRRIQSNPKWHQNIGLQIRRLEARSKPLTIDELLALEYDEFGKLIVAGLFDESGARSDAQVADDPDPVAHCADQIQPYLSDLVQDPHVDNLGATLVQILGHEQALSQPLLFFAIKGYVHLIPKASDVLFRLWHHIQRPGYWLILARRVVGDHERLVSFRHKSALFPKMQLNRPHPSVTLDTFVPTAVDLGWNGVPPLSMDFQAAHLRGVMFAGLECVSLRYGRAYWLSELPMHPYAAHFGPIALSSVLGDVLGVNVSIQLTRRWCLRMPWPFECDSIADGMDIPRWLMSHHFVSYRYTDRTNGEDDDSSNQFAAVEIEKEPLNEPVCSAAAAYVFRTDLDLYLMAVHSLKRAFERWRSQGGVILAMFLLNFTSDMAHHRQAFDGYQLDESPFEVSFYPNSRRIEGILEPVLLDKWIASVLLLLPKDTDQAAAQMDAPSYWPMQWMRRQLVNFTHFAKLPGVSCKADEALWEGVLVDGWVRQCGFVLESEEDDSDGGWQLLVPLHATNSEYVDLETGRPTRETLAIHPFEPSALSYVLIHVRPPPKNRKQQQHQAPRSPPDEARDERDPLTALNALTWSRVERNEAGRRWIEYRSHLLITIDLYSNQGAPVWRNATATARGVFPTPTPTTSTTTPPGTASGELELGLEEEVEVEVQRHELELHVQEEGGFLTEWTCALSKSEVLGNGFSKLMSEGLLRIREQLAKSS